MKIKVINIEVKETEIHKLYDLTKEILGPSPLYTVLTAYMDHVAKKFREDEKNGNKKRGSENDSGSVGHKGLNPDKCRKAGDGRRETVSGTPEADPQSDQST